MRQSGAVAVAIATSFSAGAQAQTPASAVQFLAAARVGAEAFVDQRAAIAAGYRRLGRDFPSMGEHWVNPRLVISGDFDPARPPMLAYVKVGGKPFLVGVIFAVPLRPGEKPPQLPAGAGTWHEHNGSVDEESLAPEHLQPDAAGHGHVAHANAQPDERATSSAGSRLAILHVWTHAPNPQGVFSAENWALSFIRLGFSVPDSFPESAARCLSLLTGGSEYFASLAESRSASAEIVSAILHRCRKSADAAVQSRDSARVLTRNDIDALARAWDDAMHKIARQSGRAIASALAGQSM